jgi:hypothetical protein
MTFQMIHSPDGGTARSPFRVIEQPIGREVDWVNRFLDRECVRRLRKTPYAAMPWICCTSCAGGPA